MTADELKSLKTQWYETARQDGSLALCYLVGRELGTALNSRYGPKYLWKFSNVELYVDDYGHYLTVHQDNKLVCSTHDTNRLFVPGSWVESVKNAAIVARHKTEKKEFRREQEEVNRLMSELGMTRE